MGSTVYKVDTFEHCYAIKIINKPLSDYQLEVLDQLYKKSKVLEQMPIPRVLYACNLNAKGVSRGVVVSDFVKGEHKHGVLDFNTLASVLATISKTQELLENTVEAEKVISAVEKTEKQNETLKKTQPIRAGGIWDSLFIKNSGAYELHPIC